MSRLRDRADPACKVYVGNLGNRASKVEIESAFNKFGPLRNVWVARNPPGFVFVEFEDRRDAEDSVKHLDRSRLCGVRVCVEMATGVKRGGGGGGGGPRSPPRRNRSRSRSRSRSPSRKTGRKDRSRSRSESRSRSKSPRKRTSRLDYRDRERR